MPQTIQCFQMLNVSVTRFGPITRFEPHVTGSLQMMSWSHAHSRLQADSPKTRWLLQPTNCTHVYVVPAIMLLGETPVSSHGAPDTAPGSMTRASAMAPSPLMPPAP